MTRKTTRLGTIVRAAAALLLLAGSAAALVYGVLFHSQPVLQEEEIQVEMPPLPPPMPGMEEGFPEEGPPPFAEPTTEIVHVAKPASELTLVWETTFGGVTLCDTGELLRTYSGKPPSLCPT